MQNSTRFIGFSLCCMGLSACSNYAQFDFEHYKSPAKSDPGIQLYPDGYDNGGAYAPAGAEKKPVDVPDSYHVNATQAPVSFKNRDKGWISTQNPQGYTIELANDEQASQVANALQKAPKDERTAEVEYAQDGKKHYTGVYGTYPSYEAAQQALSALPEDAKKSANIRTWGSIQNNLNP